MTILTEPAHFQIDERQSSAYGTEGQIVPFPRLESARRNLQRASHGVSAPVAELKVARAQLGGCLGELDRSVKRLDDARQQLLREAARARAIAADAEWLEQAILNNPDALMK